MSIDYCRLGRLFVPLLLLTGSVPAMDAREAATAGDNDWSIVSAPPPPGPYRSVNIDPRIPGQDVVSVPGLDREYRAGSPLPAEALRMPPAAGGVAPDSGYYARPSRSGGYIPPPVHSREPVPAPGQQDYAQPAPPGSYAPSGQYDSGGYAPPGPYEYAQPGRSTGYRPAPYSRDYGPEGQGFEQAPRYPQTVPPPGVQEDSARQPVPGPYGRGRERPPAYDYEGPDHYTRQPGQQEYRMMPPPGYYPPSQQRPLQEAPQPPIYDSMMGRPSGGSAYEDASAGVPR